MKEMVKAEAHDSEILCLEYSKPHTGACPIIPRVFSLQTWVCVWVCVTVFDRHESAGHSESRPADPRAGRRGRLRSASDAGRALVLRHVRPLRWWESRYYSQSPIRESHLRDLIAYSKFVGVAAGLESEWLYN